MKHSIPVPGFVGYEVDAEGLVWSPGQWRGLGRRPMLPTVDDDGYHRVRLTVDGKRRKVGVHILVCSTFHGPKPTPDAQVRHLDGHPSNNAEWNLTWGTGAENAADREHHGKTYCGERHHSAKLTEAEALTIRASTEPSRVLSARYGVSMATIWHIRSRKTWRAA